MIIYERYYEEDNIKYINTTNEEENFLMQYIKRHCLCQSHDIYDKNIDIVLEKKQLLLNFSQTFIYNRKFIKISNTNCYKNYSTNEECLEKDIKNN